MAAPCIASTSTVALVQDGAGTLRASAVLATGSNGNNPLVDTGAGMAVRPQNVTYGWPFAGDDSYTTQVTLAPSSGYIGYGPELFAQTQTVSVGTVIAHINWEIQAYYPGLGNSPYSGISYALQVSYDYANWSNAAESIQLSPSGQTWRWHCSATWPIAWGDNGIHNFWARMVVAAGSFGVGDAIICQYTGRRSITMMY